MVDALDLGSSGLGRASSSLAFRTKHLGQNTAPKWYRNLEPKKEVRVEHENVWLSLQQLAELFDCDKSVISRHLRNIFNSAELDREATVAKNATTAADGKTYLVEYFN